MDVDERAALTPWLEEALFAVVPPDPLFGFPNLAGLLRASADRDQNIVGLATTGDSNYIALTENALCGLSKVGVTTNVVIFALDAGAFVHFRARGLAVSLVLDPAGRMDPELLQTHGHTKFAHPHRYWLFHKRPEITAAVLRLGYNLLFCGSDIAFLSNPFEAILSSAPHPSDSDMYYVNKLGSTKAAVDIYFQNDRSGFHHPGVLERGLDCLYRDPPTGAIRASGTDLAETITVCADFFYAMSNPKSMLLFDTIASSQGTVVLSDCGRPDLNAGMLHDQAWINLLLTYYHFMLSLQPSLSESVAHVAVLDRARFPNGHVMFGREIPRRLGVCPAVVHVNWFVSSATKIEVLREHGLFELESHSDSGAWTCASQTALDTLERCPVHAASLGIKAKLVRPRV